MPEFKELRGDHVFILPVAGQATAGTADEFSGIVAPYNLKITAVKWIPAANVTADGTNYFTLNLRNRKGDASGTALAASRSYAATNSTAFVPEAMTLSGTAADLLVNAGDVLTVSKVNTGTGLAMPDGVVQVHAQVR
ncbi:MAG TPA: hypothetical protein VGX25_04045 [Actinophytocola sp.]|uniref:hypothetical protein n=1 Tax=Actinophytocola sp. TaxID=1872138 RepID=UPI002DDCF3D9|nr:hypothetical protein [Actinophytocola sp.]HEV2778550.1 hypothetical protein [Actinophytocola sp.]